MEEVVVKTTKVHHDVWRAVDHEGKVLDAFGSKTRDKTAPLKVLRELMKRPGRPEKFVTDTRRS